VSTSALKLFTLTMDAKFESKFTGTVLYLNENWRPGWHSF
jgi:hypothetical protein